MTLSNKWGLNQPIHSDKTNTCLLNENCILLSNRVESNNFELFVSDCFSSNIFLCEYV